MKTGVVQKAETSYLKFTGGTRGNDYGNVSVIIDEESTIRALKKLHKTFKLD